MTETRFCQTGFCFLLLLITLVNELVERDLFWRLLLAASDCIYW